jgi:hypothetical protein
MTPPRVERSPRWLLDPLNQCRAIHAWPIDHPRHGVHVQFQPGASGEQIQDVLHLRESWIKPGIFQLSRQDDRHPVVESRHHGIRFCRDDGKGGEVLAVWCDRGIVETGKRHERLALSMNVIRRFLVSLGLPFIVATGGHQTVVVAQQAPERGLLRQRLHPRIDHLVGRLRVLCPMWNQAPAHEHDLAEAGGHDHRHHLAGRDVIAGHQRIETIADVETIIEGFDRLKCETSAHLECPFPWSMPRRIPHRRMRRRFTKAPSVRDVHHRHPPQIAPSHRPPLSWSTNQRLQHSHDPA